MAEAGIELLSDGCAYGGRTSGKRRKKKNEDRIMAGAWGHLSSGCGASPPKIVGIAFPKILFLNSVMCPWEAGSDEPPCFLSAAKGPK